MEIWEMTKGQALVKAGYRGSSGVRYRGNFSHAKYDGAIRNHRRAVERAVAKGLPVPAEVLAECGLEGTR